MGKANTCLEHFFPKKSPEIKNERIATQVELEKELNGLYSNMGITSTLSSKHNFELRRLVRKVHRGNMKLTARECLLLNRLRILGAYLANPGRRKDIAIKHSRTKEIGNKHSLKLPRYLKIPRNDTVYKPVLYDYKLEAVGRGIISGTILISTCSHFLIGSSLIFKLLCGKLQIADTHKYLITSENRKFGKIAENCAASMFNNDFLKQQARLVPLLPFIVACPDFYFEKLHKIIEIKSYNEKRKGVKMSILQTIISMEAFEITSGEIWFFNTNTKEQTTKLEFITKLKKIVSLFNEKVIEETILAYVNYMKVLLESTNYSSSQDEVDRMILLFKEYSRRRKLFSLIPPPLSQTEFCRKVLQYIHIKMPKVSPLP